VILIEIIKVFGVPRLLLKGAPQHNPKSGLSFTVPYISKRYISTLTSRRKSVGVNSPSDSSSDMSQKLDNLLASDLSNSGDEIKEKNPRVRQ